MEWHSLFRPHILARGYDYYLDDKVNITNESNTEVVAEVNGSEKYTVNIGLRNGSIDYMECDCPYAEDGNYCKHMAATLYQYFDGNELTDIDYDEDACQRITRHADEKKAAIDDLLQKIPEAKKHQLLINILLENPELTTTLKLEYDFQMNAKQMLAFKNEIQNIVREHTVRGFVDWNNAFALCCSLERFLDNRVDILIENHCLLQAFELNNQVFKVIGTIDMDDSDGGSCMVAEKCYEKWQKIYQNANDAEKEKITAYFSAYKDGALLNYIEDYLFEFRQNELASAEEIAAAMNELDQLLAACDGSNDCGYIYSIRDGHKSVIEKRIEYMKKLGASKEAVDSFCKQNRNFFVVRNMEIDNAIENKKYENAIALLTESKKLDQNNRSLLEKYSLKLIDLYEKTGNTTKYIEEIKYNLLNCTQIDAKLFKKLKKNVPDGAEWALLSEEIINKNKGNPAIYTFLIEEKRYDQMMDMIGKSHDIFVMNNYVGILSKNIPDRVIRFYEEYLIEEIKRASDRKHYKFLVKYLKTMSFCSAGKETAKKIAERWKQEYRRRSALLDELSKAGY